VIAAAVAAGSVLTVAGAGIAAANGSGGPRQQGPAVVRHHTGASTCISLWAVVNKSGGLVRAGCPGTTSAHVIGTGHYQVVFKRNVRRCVYIATAGNGGSIGIPPADFATVVGREGNKDGVYIAVYDATGAPVDHGFHLLVECRLPSIP
jgi:subtilisin family serine protease